VRRVRVSGTYDAGRTLLVPGRERAGRDGFLVVTPLRSADGVVPVLRGWVPTRRSPAVRGPDGQVLVTGRLQASESSDASAVDPLDPLPSGQVAYVSTVVLLDAWRVPSQQIYDGYVVLGRERPAASATPATVAAQRPSGGVSRWRNLAYALQWWLFAGAAVFFWASVLRRAYSERRRPRDDDPSALIMQ
jgi:cytochrome oxidase assembly protein ShyY1